MSKIRNATDFNNTIDEIANIDLALKKLDAQRASALQKVEERFNPQLNELQSQREELRASAEIFARANREELFGKAKSLKTTLGVCAFRVARSLRLIKPEDEVVAILFGSGLGSYVRTKNSADKTAMKKALEQNNPAFAQLAEITESETFEIKPRA